MPIKVLIGLPYLSDGPLLRKAKAMNAPILVSANAFAVFKDCGPVPPGYELSEFERSIGAKVTEAAKRRRMREWIGWNTRSLKNVSEDQEIVLDSAGFHYQVAAGGYPFTPEAYVHGLCTAFPFARFASLDLCVEAEIASNRAEVAERVSKTIHLNKRCAIAARDAGIEEKLMPVIQGATPDDYLRCFDALAGLIGDERVIGVGSMCRRPTSGPSGVPAIVDALHRSLPRGIKLHLFGAKGDAVGLVADLDGRVESIDSQAYGVRARRIANDKRAADPSFSKSNAFVAEVMEDWLSKQRARMAAPKRKPIQNSFLFEAPPAPTITPMIDALEARARDHINSLIEAMDLDYDQIVGGRMLEEWLAEMPDEDDEENLFSPLPPAIPNYVPAPALRMAA